MPRHIIEKPKARKNGRAAAFLKIDRDASPSAATRALQERPKQGSKGRLKEYTRIERGVEA